MGVDRRGNRRGKCTACDCDEFELPPTDDINMCFFCGHHSPLHERIETNKEACMHEGKFYYRQITFRHICIVIAVPVKHNGS